MDELILKYGGVTAGCSLALQLKLVIELVTAREEIQLGSPVLGVMLAWVNGLHAKVPPNRPVDVNGTCVPKVALPLAVAVAVVPAPFEPAVRASVDVDVTRPLSTERGTTNVSDENVNGTPTNVTARAHADEATWEIECVWLGASRFVACHSLPADDPGTRKILVIGRVALDAGGCWVIPVGTPVVALRFSGMAPESM